MGFWKEVFPNFTGKKIQKIANDRGVLDSQKIEKPKRQEPEKKTLDNQGERGYDKEMSRRDFLRTAAIGTASLTYGTSLGAAKKIHNYLAEDDTPAAEPTIIKRKIKQTVQSNNDDQEVRQKDASQNPEAETIAQEGAIIKPEKRNENICGHFINAYEFLSSCENKDGKKEFWKDNVFTDKFFIAIQLTESNFEEDAVSNKNAYGIMQIREIAIKDVIKFLNKLKRTGVYDNYDGPDFKQLEMDKWKSEVESLKESLKKEKDKKKSDRIKDFREQIKKQEEKNRPILDEIVKTIKKDSNYNRAIGKSYFMQLFNKNYGYGIGWDEYQKGDIKEVQKKLAMAYNCGPTHFKKNYPNGYFDQETKNYPIKVFNFEKRFDNIKTAFEKNGIKANNEAIMLMARRMNATKDNKLRYKMLDTYIEKLKEDDNLLNLKEDWPKKKIQYKLLIAKNFDIFDKKK